MTPTKTPAKRASNKCLYCYGHGLYAGFWDFNMRRPMERGTKGRSMHEKERCYQCDRCGEPKEFGPPPPRDYK